MRLRSLFEQVPAVLGQGSWEMNIASITANSKKVEKGSLFICIQGMNQDGHLYIEEAVQRGAVACLINESFWQKEKSEPSMIRRLPKNITMILVQDTREAAAGVAAAFYHYPSRELKVIGVTGTKGKTSVTFMIRDILEKAGYKTGLLGTIDYEIGSQKQKACRTTPEAVDIQRYLREMVDQGCQFAVMEVSSQGLKLHRADAIVFDVGVFTNLGKDHIGPGEHQDMEEYMACKCLLFQRCRMGIVNGDDPHAQKIFETAICPIQTYGCRQKADVRASDIMFVNRHGRLGTFFKVNGEEYEVSAPGYFSVYNAAAAIAVCEYYGIDAAAIHEALSVVRVPGRMEVVDNDRGYLVMIDYAHNAMSLKNVLETMRRYHPRRLCVLFGCGGGRSAERRKSMGRIAGKYADLTIITSDNPRDEAPGAIMQAIEAGIKETAGHYRMIEDRKEAIRYLLENGRPGDILILAGKGHEQYQEIKGNFVSFDERQIVREILQENRSA